MDNDIIEEIKIISYLLVVCPVGVIFLPGLFPDILC